MLFRSDVAALTELLRQDATLEMPPQPYWFAGRDRVARFLGRVVLTAPGRFQLIVPNVASINAGAYPGVLTPAFVVPSSILLHALSLRQLRRRGLAEASRR